MKGKWSCTPLCWLRQNKDVKKVVQHCSKKKKEVELWAMPLAPRTGKCNGSWDRDAGCYICIPTDNTFADHTPLIISTAAPWALLWPCTGAFTRRTASSRPTAPMTTRGEACGSGRSSPGGAGVRSEPAFTCWGRGSPSSAGCPGTDWRSGF